MNQKLTKERINDLKIIVMLSKKLYGVEPKLSRVGEFKIVDSARITRERIHNEEYNGSVPLVGIDYNKEVPIHFAEYFIKGEAVIYLN